MDDFLNCLQVEKSDTLASLAVKYKVSVSTSLVNAFKSALK